MQRRRWTPCSILTISDNKFISFPICCFCSTNIANVVLCIPLAHFWGSFVWETAWFRDIGKAETEPGPGGHQLTAWHLCSAEKVFTGGECSVPCRKSFGISDFRSRRIRPQLPFSGPSLSISATSLKVKSQPRQAVSHKLKFYMCLYAKLTVN